MLFLPEEGKLDTIVDVAISLRWMSTASSLTILRRARSATSLNSRDSILLGTNFFFGSKLFLESSGAAPMSEVAGLGDAAEIDDASYLVTCG